MVRSLLVLATLTPIVASKVAAQCVEADIPAPGTCFGWDVAFDGERLAVGDVSYGGGASVFGRGAVHSYRWSGASWEQEAMLVASDGADADSFGYSVDLDGEWLVAGAPATDDLGQNSGAAYVFRHTDAGWVEHQKLIPPDGGALNLFGSAVAIDGSTLAVATRIFNATYVYELEGGVWRRKAKLLAQGTVTLDLCGDVLAIGASGNDQVAVNAGAVFIFRRNAGGWTPEATLFASDGAGQEYFGQSVSVTDGAIAVGAAVHAHGGLTTGGAYVFVEQGGTWVEEAELCAPSVGQGDQFGWSVAIDGDALVVGSPGVDDQGFNTGAAYVFRRIAGAWSPIDRFLPPSPSPAGSFGEQVAIQGDEVAVGCYCGGSVLVRTSPPPPTSTCSAVPNSTGRAARIAFLGAPSLTANDARLVATDCPPLEPALFLASRTSGQIPFGPGFLCLDRPLVRLHPVLFADAAGRVGLDLDLTALPNQTVLAPGETLYFQLWHADGGGFNTSRGVAVTFCR